MAGDRDLLIGIDVGDGADTASDPIGDRSRRSTHGVVSSERYESRLSACRSCHRYRQITADSGLIGLADGQDVGECSRTGLLTVAMARFSTARCPERSLDDPRLSRWGEPV